VRSLWGPIGLLCPLCSLHLRHCPEFTLTYPDYDPTNKWEDAMQRVDEEVCEGGGGEEGCLVQQ
jgi:hypothetical protein